MFPEAQVIQSGALVMAAIYVGFIKVCKNKYRFHGGMLGYCIGFKNGRLITWGGQMPTHYRTQRTLFVLPILLLFVLPLLKLKFQALLLLFSDDDQFSQPSFDAFAEWHGIQFCHVQMWPDCPFSTKPCSLGQNVSCSIPA